MHPVRTRPFQLPLAHAWRTLPVFVSLLGLGAASHAEPTLYGLIDVGLASTDAGLGRLTSLDSGVVLGSSYGLRGDEDLGGGSKAVYTLENGFNVDTGAQGQGGLLFGRQAFVGFTNDSYGRITMGRHYSVFHTTLATYSLGGLVWGNALNYFRDGSILRLDNSIRYESPQFYGFSSKLMVALGEQAGSSVGNVFNPSIDYRNGAFQVGASSLQRRKVAGNDERFNTLGANYDAGWIKVAALAYTQRDQLPAATSLARNAFELSATLPVGTNAVWLSYGQDHGKARAQSDASAISARFDYTLSKRTRLYVGYSVIHNQANANFTVNSASNAGPTVTLGHNVNQAVLGMLHSF